MINLLCRFKLHKWVIYNSISVGDILSKMKYKNLLVNRTFYEFNRNIKIYDRKCIRCGIKEENIKFAKLIIKQKIIHNNKKR